MLTDINHKLRTMQRELNRETRTLLAENDLTTQQWATLRAVKGNSGVGAAALAAAVGVLGPSMSRTLNHLRDRGLVTVDTCDGDRRNVAIKTTPEGRRIMRKLRPLVEKADYATVDRLGFGRLERLAKALG